VKRACLRLRRSHYTRWQFFERGLRRLGFAVGDNPNSPRPGDVLVMWNRFPHNERWAKEFESVGAVVIIAENGWIGKIDDCRPIALARSHHNGAGWWPMGAGDRWPRFGVALAPWRQDGEHILVLPQRGYGEAGVAMPPSWAAMVQQRLRALTRRKVVLRRHPGVEQPDDPDFSGAWAAVTWASGAGIKALAAGVPVFHEMPHWLGAPAARFGIDAIETPVMPDRLPMFRRLAWAQWSPHEIETGEALAPLINY
jgi:hypothetical protein